VFADDASCDSVIDEEGAESPPPRRDSTVLQLIPKGALTGRGVLFEGRANDNDDVAAAAAAGGAAVLVAEAAAVSGRAEEHGGGGAEDDAPTTIAAAAAADRTVEPRRLFVRFMVSTSTRNVYLVCGGVGRWTGGVG
jgi:hypothetical protein